MDLHKNNTICSISNVGNNHSMHNFDDLEERVSRTGSESKRSQVELNVQAMLLARNILTERLLLLEKSIEDKNEEMQLLKELINDSRRLEEYGITRFGSDIKYHTIKLCKTINFPGFRIFQNIGISRVHTLFWIVLHIVLFLISYTYIKEAYITWQESPTIHGAKNSLTEVKNIPFPAVTICFPNTLNRNYHLMKHIDKCFKCDDINNTCEVAADCSETDMIALHFSFTLCDADIWYEQDSSRYVAMKEFFRNKTYVRAEQYDKVIKHLLPQCETNLMKLYDVVSEFNMCADVFQPILMIPNRNTICTTYNSLALGSIFEANITSSVFPNLKLVFDLSTSDFQWTTDNMLGLWNRDLPIPDYNPGSRIVVFKSPGDREEFCSPGVETDYKIALHHPGEIPMPGNTNFYSYTIGSNVEMQIQPILTSAHDSIVQIQPKHRGCYFSHESKLALFKFYSQKNCLLECKVNCSITICGCVPFNLPRINSSVNVCLEFPGEESCESKYSRESTSSCRCTCLPDCNSLSYEHDIKAADTTVYGHEPKIVIQYQVNQFTSYVRFSIVDSMQFISYAFGMLLMFNGITLIFIFEIVYLIMLQVWKCLKSYYV